VQYQLVGRASWRAGTIPAGWDSQAPNKLALYQLAGRDPAMVLNLHWDTRGYLPQVPGYPSEMAAAGAGVANAWFLWGGTHTCGGYPGAKWHLEFDLFSFAPSPLNNPRPLCSLFISFLFIVSFRLSVLIKLTFPWLNICYSQSFPSFILYYIFSNFFSPVFWT
jgi:hypothetical protein